MGKRGWKRSSHARERRLVNRTVSRNAFIDRVKYESINTLTPREIVKAVMKIIGFIPHKEAVEHAGKFDRGEILSDTRGKGTLQFGVE